MDGKVTCLPLSLLHALIGRIWWWFFFKICQYYSFHNRNEFLAVRNAEGSFYICQAMQNIYRSSPRIRIRWLSQEKKDNKSTDVYIPDFYDATGSDAFKIHIYINYHLVKWCYDQCNHFSSDQYVFQIQVCEFQYRFTMTFAS